MKIRLGWNFLESFFNDRIVIPSPISKVVFFSPSFSHSDTPIPDEWYHYNILPILTYFIKNNTVHIVYSIRSAPYFAENRASWGFCCAGCPLWHSPKIIAFLSSLNNSKSQKQFYNKTSRAGLKTTVGAKQLGENFNGQGRSWTGDTWIFSPLLYHLSYERDQRQL